MTNRDKFKSTNEALEAHNEWCRGNRELSRRCCMQECYQCFKDWLDLKVEEEVKDDEKQ